jgi:hypothetical protein
LKGKPVAVALLVLFSAQAQHGSGCNGKVIQVCKINPSQSRIGVSVRRRVQTTDRCRITEKMRRLSSISDGGIEKFRFVVFV